MTPLIYFNCLLIQQAKDVIKAVEGSGVDYSALIGPHLRHVVEHYQLLLAGLPAAVVDYECRVRGGQLESDPQAALVALNSVEQALTQHSLPLDTPISTTFAVGVSGEGQCTTQSSLGRELQFVGLHAIHHYAFVALALKEAQLKLPEGFGVAPGTRRYAASGDVASAA